MKNSIPAIPSIFDALIKKSPSVAAWARDKVQTHFKDQSSIEFEGKEYKAERWYFNGSFARAPKESHQYSEDGTTEVSVTVRGGQYRGEKYRVQVGFTNWTVA